MTQMIYIAASTKYINIPGQCLYAKVINMMEGRVSAILSSKNKIHKISFWVRAKKPGGIEGHWISVDIFVVGHFPIHDLPFSANEPPPAMNLGQNIYCHTLQKIVN